MNDRFTCCFSLLSAFFLASSLNAGMSEEVIARKNSSLPQRVYKKDKYPKKNLRKNCFSKIKKQKESQLSSVDRECEKSVSINFFAWKDKVLQEVSDDSDLIKEIISCGESPEEVDDFIGRLADQRAWFHETIQGLSSFTDDTYPVVSTKQQQLAIIAAAQRMADEILVKKNLSPSKYNKSRLNILYELYLLVARTGYQLPDQEAMRELVDRIAQQSNFTMTPYSQAYEDANVSQKSSQLALQKMDRIFSETKREQIEMNIALRQSLEQQKIGRAMFQDSLMQKELIQAQIEKQKAQEEARLSMITCEQLGSNVKELENKLHILDEIASRMH